MQSKHYGESRILIDASRAAIYVTLNCSGLSLASNNHVDFINVNSSARPYKREYPLRIPLSTNKMQQVLCTIVILNTSTPQYLRDSYFVLLKDSENLQKLASIIKSCKRLYGLHANILLLLRFTKLPSDLTKILFNFLC